MTDEMAREKVYWNKMSSQYDQFVETEYQGLYKRARKLFSQYVKRNHKVLDVATGTGKIALTLSKKSKDITGLDISSKMIRIASSRSKGNPRFVVGDAHELDFKRGAFDLVTCCNGLHVFRDPAQAMAEMRRVLTAGGKLVTVTFAFGDAVLGQKMHNWGLFMKYGMPPNWESYTGPEIRSMHYKAGLKILKAIYCWNDPPTVLIVARK